MSENFHFDVFLSHSSKDKATVRELAERLRSDGVRVWFDEWLIKPNKPSGPQIQRGIEQSRTLVVCMSPDFFESEWTKLEPYSLLFRDPSNKARRFIPLMKDDCRPPEAIAQFLFIDWRDKSEEKYQELLKACRMDEKTMSESAETRAEKQHKEKHIEKIKKSIVLKEHSDWVNAVAVTPDGNYIISGSWDKTIRIWGLDSGRCLNILEGHSDAVNAVAVTPDGNYIISGSDDTTIHIWDFPKLETHILTSLPVPSISDSKLYTNAKVALIGDSGVGKTGLAIRLVEDRWERSDSTHGMNVWSLPLTDLNTTEMEREVWLWDFAGQPDYRLTHQLYMDETALAIMVIDPQTANPFEPLAHWEKALNIAVKNKPAKLLVAARCERGGLTISRKKLDQYCIDHGYEHFQTTSAKTGDGCNELKEAIKKHIPWDRLTKTSTLTLFKTLKDSVISMKQENIALIRFAELHQRLQLELQQKTIEEADLRAVIGLLGGQWIIRPLDFGDFILLHPEEINKYAAVIVQAARNNSDDIGCVSERDVLAAQLPFPKDMKRLKAADEQFLLREVVNMFIKRSLCINEETPRGPQLIFPSYFKQERSEIPDHPNVYVTFGFSGVLDEIYSSLVVRLHHTEIFEKKELWKDAADFVTVPTNKKAGFMMTRKTEGEAEIEVYLEQEMADEMKVYFIEFIRKHLLQKDKNLVRIRHYVCSHCGNAVETQRTQRRIGNGFKDIQCDYCSGTILLDDLIEKFASEKIRLAVNKMDEQADNKKDNDSLDRILVGHATAIVAEAGQIFREFTILDKGLDGEIEFLDDNGDASGERVYLQLKSGDSYLRHRQRDEKEIFDIKKPRWAEYWQKHKYPVMLVVRTSDGRIRWMNVTEYLKKHGAETKQIIFDGEMFTALNVARMRDKILGK